MDLSDLAGWATIGLILAVPVVLAGVGLTTRFRSRKGEQISSGALGGIDEVFHPSGYNARTEWDAQQEIPEPAPTPDKGPGVIEGGRITIALDDDRR